MVNINRSPHVAYYFINDEDGSPLSDSARNALDKALSYMTKDYQRTDAWIEGKWDGSVHLFNKASTGSYYFPCGLLQDVCHILDLYDIPYRVSNPVINTYSVTCHMSHLSLRDYQVKIIDDLRANDWKGVVSLPTGAGKGMIGLKIISELQIPTIIFVHRKELLKQWVDLIRKYLGQEVVGTIGGGRHVTGDITVATYQGAALGLKTGQFDRFRQPLIIADETHLVAAKTFYKTLMSCTGQYRIGLTATPSREDGEEMKIFAGIGPLVGDVSIEWLIEQKFLARPSFEFIRMPPTKVSGTPSYFEVYKVGVVGNIERNNAVIKAVYDMLDEGRQVYVHVTNVHHGRMLAEHIEGARFVYSKTKSRDQDIQDFRDGSYKCLVSTLLKEGVSIDGITGLVYASGGKSETSVIQTIGRSLRMDEKFGDAKIVDFIDSGHRWLKAHSEERLMTYRNYYGKYCGV